MPTIKIGDNSIKWAMKHLLEQRDTDIFPFPIELNIINDEIDYVSTKLRNKGISEYKWHYARRFIMPKDLLSFRIVTQLDPIDSLFLAALIKEFGHIIEDSRVPAEDKVVFGNRYEPSADGRLFKSDRQWRKYWLRNQELINSHKIALKVDIADFYNQIYHHNIENALIQIGGGNQLMNSIKNFIGKITYKVSRGIPVGPHSTHLLAELVLISIDNELLNKRIRYTRYMDDFVFYCDSELEGKIILNKFAQILDKQGRLTLQRHKTEMYSETEFKDICKSKLDEKTLDETEKEILKIVKDHLEEDEDEYSDKIKWEDLTDQQKDYFQELYYDKLFNKYLDNSEGPDYSKLRWLFRRLTQIGVPFAIQKTLEYFDDLIPVLPDICEYFIAASPNLEDDLVVTGEEIIDILESEIVQSNEFVQISLIDLFVNNIELNHFHLFDDLFSNSSEFVKRKIILLAYELNNVAWIRGKKEQYDDLGKWAKRALLIAFSKLPRDERRFIYNSISEDIGESQILEHTIIRWGKKR